MRRNCCLTLLLALWLAVDLHAAAADVPYTPPPVGLTITMEANIQGSPIEITQRVTAVDGDIVFVRGSSPGHDDERYFRFLVSTKSGDIQYHMDTAKLAALWPLAPGKAVSLSGVAYSSGKEMPFDLSVTVQDYETISVSAGTFDTVRIYYELTIASGGTEARVESTTWMDVASSLPIRNETTVFAQGGSFDLSMEAKSFD